jgi:hypothetical protein
MASTSQAVPPTGPVPLTASSAPPRYTDPPPPYQPPKTAVVTPPSGFSSATATTTSSNSSIDVRRCPTGHPLRRPNPDAAPRRTPNGNGPGSPGDDSIRRWVCNECGRASDPSRPLAEQRSMFCIECNYDICSLCSGVWFDPLGHELQRVSSSPSLLGRDAAPRRNWSCFVCKEEFVREGPSAQRGAMDREERVVRTEPSADELLLELNWSEGLLAPPAESPAVGCNHPMCFPGRYICKSCVAGRERGTHAMLFLTEEAAAIQLSTAVAAKPSTGGAAGGAASSPLCCIDCTMPIICPQDEGACFCALCEMYWCGNCLGRKTVEDKTLRSMLEADVDILIERCRVGRLGPDDMSQHVLRYYQHLNCTEEVSRTLDRVLGKRRLYLSKKGAGAAGGPSDQRSPRPPMTTEQQRAFMVINLLQRGLNRARTRAVMEATMD